MDVILNNCERIQERLNEKVESLSDLRNAIREVQGVLDADSTDQLYQPIEDLYRLLQFDNLMHLML